MHTEPAPSPPIPVQFKMDLDPFKAFAMSVATAKRLSAVRNEHGANTSISLVLLLWICENDKAGRKSKTILQHSNKFRVLRVRSRFLTFIQLVQWGRLYFFVDSKNSKWIQTMTTHNLQILPPKTRQLSQ